MVALDKDIMPYTEMDQLHKIKSESEANIKIEGETNPVKPQDLTEKCDKAIGETKVQLNFSVDRLLNKDHVVTTTATTVATHPKEKNCLVGSQHEIHHRPSMPPLSQTYQSACLQGENRTKAFHEAVTSATGTNYTDFKSVVRPMPIRALGNNCEVPACAPFPSFATASLLRFHQQQKQNHSNLSLAPLIAPLGGLKALQLNPHANQHFSQAAASRFQATKSLADIPGTLQHAHHSQQPSISNSNSANTLTAGNPGNNSSGSNPSSSSLGSGKRKRSWSRAVFSNLQRKGLEIQFQQQKYITKPDRRKLAARLNLTDAQVKVWFQNRRMKWRHTRENLKSGQEKQVTTATDSQTGTGSGTVKDNKTLPGTEEQNRELDYSSDSTCSLEMSEGEDDDEIDVVE